MKPLCDLSILPKVLLTRIIIKKFFSSFINVERHKLWTNITKKEIGKGTKARNYNFKVINTFQVMIWKVGGIVWLSSLSLFFSFFPFALYTEMRKPSTKKLSSLFLYHLVDSVSSLRGKTNPDQTLNRKNTNFFYNFFLLITQNDLLLYIDIENIISNAKKIITMLFTVKNVLFF